MIKYMVTQNNTASYFDNYDDAVASMIYDDAELWQMVEENSYIKVYI